MVATQHVRLAGEDDRFGFADRSSDEWTAGGAL
jgi:hypothetical protein